MLPQALAFFEAVLLHDLMGDGASVGVDGEKNCTFLSYKRYRLLCRAVQDSELQLAGLRLFRQNEGICFYMKNICCNNATPQL